MLWKLTSSAFCLAVLAAAAAPLAAQESREDRLTREVEELRAEVKAMKEASARREALPIGLDRDGTGLFELLEQIAKEVKVTGFVDVGFNYNSDRPITGTNALRAFDAKANSFMLHNGQIAFERLATKDLIAGFKVELSMGSDAEVIDAAPGDAVGGDFDTFDVQEGYVQLYVPIENGIDVKFGKFATLSGFEVIESRDDWNYSRSLLFTWAIPFTHTGVRASYQVIPEVGVTLGLNNGWDISLDNGSAKTLEAQVAGAPLEWLKLYATLYWGAEKGQVGLREPGDKRLLFDFVAVATNIPELPGLSVGLNYDKAREDDVVAPFPSHATWDGYAFYAKYQVLEWYAPGLRYEKFSDRDGWRTGTDNHVTEFTLTNEFKPADNVILRLELRADKSDVKIYPDHQGVLDDALMTIGVEAIVSF
jgi:hypothetical protein